MRKGFGVSGLPVMGADLKAVTLRIPYLLFFRQVGPAIPA